MRGDGVAGESMRVQLFTLKSYAHVSLGVPKFHPLKRITRPEAESYAMAGDERPGGLTTGAMFVHVFVLKSYAHVSLGQNPPD